MDPTRRSKLALIGFMTFSMVVVLLTKIFFIDSERALARDITTTDKIPSNLIKEISRK